jgi:hypothetical protein
MAGLRAQIAPNLSDLVFRFPHNWTAIVFFGMLGLLHLCNAGYSFWDGHYEAYLSLVLAAVFMSVALGWRLVRCDLGVMQSERRLRLRTRLGRIGTERSIPFTRVHGVRLFSNGSEAANGCRVEILCENEDIECPPTDVPRQQALCLAMLMGVTLIKVSDSEGDDGGMHRSVATPQGQPQ